MGDRTEWFWGLVLAVILHIGCVESNPGPNEAPSGNNIRKRYGSFDNRNAGYWSQEELSTGFSVCWPWNWWCRREGIFSEEEEHLVQNTSRERVHTQDSSDDELLRDHAVPYNDIPAAPILSQPTNLKEAETLRQSADHLEQQLKREQQRRRNEQRAEQLRQLYEAARTTHLEQDRVHEQVHRRVELEHQLQQNALERKRLEATVLEEIEKRQQTEDLLQAQLLDKELHLRSHLEEEEIQRRILQEQLNDEQKKSKSVGEKLERTEMQRQTLQRQCDLLKFQLQEEMKLKTETEKELLFVQTSEQELQRKLKDISEQRSYSGSNESESKGHSDEKPPQTDLMDIGLSEEHSCSISEHGRTIRFPKTEDLRNMLMKAIEDKIRLQRLLQKQVAVNEEMQIKAKKELKLQRKFLEKEFRKELSRIEKMFPDEHLNLQDQETAIQDVEEEILKNCDNDETGFSKSESISVRSDMGSEESVSTEQESEDDVHGKGDDISDLVSISVDEDERQEIRQLLLEELQRLQAYANGEQELKQDEPRHENESYRQEQDERNRPFTNEPLNVQREKILGEEIEAILLRHPFKTENEMLYNDDNGSQIYEAENVRKNMEDGITLGVETEKPMNVLKDKPITKSCYDSYLKLHQDDLERESQYIRATKNVAEPNSKHKESTPESDDIIQQMPEHVPKYELLSDNEKNSVSDCSSFSALECDVFHKYVAIGASETDGTNEQFSRNYMSSELCVSKEYNKQGLVTFQGYKVDIRALIGDVDPNHELQILLQKHLNDSTTLVPPDLSSQNNEESRSVQRNVYIKEDILRQKISKLCTTFAISGVSKEEMEDLVLQEEIVEKLKDSGVENPGRKFVILNDATAEKDYEDLCVKAKDFRDIHWLQKENDQKEFVWKKSQNNIKLIRKFIDTHSHITYPSLAEINERCSIISATSEEGVSTFLDQLSVDFKKRDPTYWVVKLPISGKKKMINESDIVHAQILEIMWKSTGATSDLERKLFEHCFHSTGKVILLLQDVRENIDEAFLRALLQTKINRMIVTVHPQCQNSIEDILSTLAFNLTPLNESEQKKVLIKTWNIADGNQQHIEDFSIALLRAAGRGRLKPTPLHLNMLAYTYKADLENYISKRYLEVPTLIDDKALYETYIETCFEQEILESNILIEDGSLRDTYFYSITADALKLLFPDCDSMFPVIIEANVEVKSLHYCIAEYLCAKWFEKHFEVYRPFIREKYFSKELRRVWFLFDSILAEGSELHLATIHGDVTRVQELIDAGEDINSLDRGDRTPIHVAAIHGHISIAKLFIQRMNKGYAVNDKILKWTPLRYADEFENWELIDLLLGAGECPSDLERTRESIHNERVFQSVISRAASAGYKHLLHSLLGMSEFLVSTTLHTGTFFHKKYTLMHIAAENGHTQIVDYLMRLPVRAELHAWDGSTPLHLAARHGHAETVRRLLSATTADVSNNRGDTPLHEAVKNGHLNVAIVLLEEGNAHPSSRNADGDSALHIACRSGNVTFVSLLLDYGADRNILDGNGDLPLECAIKFGQSTVVRYLVEKYGKNFLNGAVKGKRNAQHSPLHVAAAMGDILSMEYLLRAAGCDVVDIPNEGGDTPLHLAALQSSSSMAEFLLFKCAADPSQTNIYGNTALHIAVIREDYATVRMLLAHPHSLMDIANAGGNLPLHLACSRGNLQMIHCLLQSDQDKHTAMVKNREMKTPLQLAVERSSVDIAVVKLLVEAGSDVNVRDRHGNTILHQSVSTVRADIAKLILNTGVALTELRNSMGHTALLSAVRSGQAEIIAVLAEGGADVNASTSDGNSALHVAVVSNPATVTTLLAHGAHPNARNAEGNTALHRAIYVNNEDMVRILVERGADKKSRNTAGQSPKDLALHLHSSEDILGYL